MIRFLFRILAILPLILFAKNLSAIDIIPDFLDTLQTVEPKPFRIHEINSEIEKAEKKFNRMTYILSPDASVQKIDNDFRVYQITLQKEFEELKTIKMSHYTKFVLDNTFFIWSDFNLKLKGWQTKINSRIVKNRSYIAELDEIDKRWLLTLNDQNVINGSDLLKSRIQAVINEAGKYKAKFLDKENELISLENEIARESSFCTNIVEGVVQRQVSLRDSLFNATSPAFWNISLNKEQDLPIVDNLKNFFFQTTKTVRIYLSTENKSLILGLLLFCVLLVFSIKLSFSKLHVYDADEIQNKGIQNILFNHPVLAIFALFLITYRLFFPYHPLIIGKMSVLFLLVVSRYFIPHFNNRQVKRFFGGMIFLLALNYLQVMFWYFGNISRYYVLTEQVIGLLISAYYLTPGFWKQTPKTFKLMRAAGILAILVFIFFLISLIANLFGYFDLAILMLKAGIHIPAYTIIIYGIYKIWIALTNAGVLIGKATKQTYITHYWEKIEKRIVQIVTVSLVLFWIYSIVGLFEFNLQTNLWVSDFLVKRWTIGTLQITISAILSLIIILLITFFLTGIIKFIIDDEFIKRSKLPRGVANAISVSIRYIIVLTGLTFALSAAGIDLGKFSLLAGALGVGIGFGLQNVVNNFISGLILVYERPLQVGDTIEIENLLGQVKQIGLRSSHVMTFEGAEVVVPNGNLISNQLINWTLSDNRRRIEVKVGAAYGSDPNIILKILEEVANENPAILTDPAPMALFDGFGDSSLNFRLLYWVPFEMGIQTKSDVSIAIYNKFKANNIEIPFPQLDLHLKDKISEL